MLTGRLKSLITNTLRDSIYIVRYCNNDSINNSNDVYIFIQRNFYEVNETL